MLTALQMVLQNTLATEIQFDQHICVLGSVPLCLLSPILLTPHPHPKAKNNCEFVGKYSLTLGLGFVVRGS